jgi:feruloyl esterase
MFAEFAAAAPTMACAELASLTLKDEAFGKPITDLKATRIAAEGATPEHCQVEGRIWPETDFMLKLPTTGWNHRFVMTGNGGPAGALRAPLLLPFLAQGYAVAGDTGGHLGDRPLFSFGFNPPDNSNPNAAQKLIDFAYRSIHESTQLSRSIIEAFYGEKAARAYYVGSSQGGRQGMKIAQVKPEDFDGWVIGYPVLDITGVTTQAVWNSQAALSGPGLLRPQQMQSLYNAVQTKCDATDGVKDGLVSDPQHCAFDPPRDLTQCRDRQEDDTCFTPAQIEAVKKVQHGPVTRAGKRLFLGTPLGSSVAAPGPDGTSRSLWVPMILPMNPADLKTSLGFAYGESYTKYLLLKSPDWNWSTWNLDDYEAKAQELHRTVDAVDADLRKVKDSGKKIVQFHGWADALVTPFVSTDYYEKVQAKLGADATHSFYKLYMIPGMGHGPSMGPNDVGKGPNNLTDWLSLVRSWVEEGKEPSVLVASRAANAQAGLSALTRPLCPYPQVAKYKNGDASSAASFICAGAVR